MTNRLLLSSVILFIFVPFACAAGDSATFLYLKAAQLEQSGELDEASRTYKLALSKESSPTVYMKLAGLERRRGDTDAAFSILERAGKEYPKNSEIAFFTGAFCLDKARIANDSAEERKKWLGRAMASFGNAAEIEPNEQHLVAYAYAATEFGDNGKALEVYDQLINDFGKAEYYRPRGVLKIGIGQREEGLKDIEKAAEEADDLQALIRLADLAREDNKTEAAAAYLMRALELAPDMAEVSYYLAEIYKNQKDYGAAVRFYMQAAENMNGRTRLAILKQVGDLSLENGDFSAAFDAYVTALSENADDPQLYYRAGYAAVRDGQNERAQGIFDEGISKFPDYTMLRKRSALNLIIMDKPHEAAEMMEKIDEVERDLDYYLILADAYAEIPNHEKSISIINKGLKENPNSIELYIAQAMNFEKAKRYEDCVELLKKALTIDPDSASVQNFLGYLYADLNRNLDEAELLLNRALAKEPDNYAYLDSMAWLLYRKGKHKEAYDLILKAIEINPDDPEILEHLEQIRKKLPSGKGR